MSRVFMDGNKWCCVADDFINPQESIAGFGDTPEEAKRDLAVAEERERLLKVLAAMYHTHCLVVAELCDAHLDPAGKMLGVVRERAAILKQQP